MRHPDRWYAAGFTEAPRRADIADTIGLRAALADANHIVSCAHARFAGAILATAPAVARLVFLGSTRKFTRWPDDHAKGVITGESAVLASGRNGVLLHPTMIYGAQGEDNVQRLARLLRSLPVLPLPEGGRCLVQPIHQDDVTRAIRAAIKQPWTRPSAIVLAGPVAMSYADFTRAIAAAIGLPAPLIVPVSARLLMAAAPITGILPGIPRVRPAEIRRLLEDKAFDITAMRTVLGIEPISLQAGLARTFSSQ